MAAPIPTTEPQSVTAGDSVVFTKTVCDYPASDGWTLTYFFKTPDGSQKFNFTATTAANGTDYAVTVNNTAAWQPGEYIGQAKVAGVGGQTFTVWSGILRVYPSVAANADTRSHARKCLDNIEAVLEKKATHEVLNSEVNGVKLERIPFDQLIALRDRYRMEVRNEEAALRIKQGLGSGRKILTRFTPQEGPYNPTWQTRPWQ